MANRKILLCLILALLAVNCVKCGRSRSGGDSRSHSSGGRSHSNGSSGSRWGSSGRSSRGGGSSGSKWGSSSGSSSSWGGHSSAYSPSASSGLKWGSSSVSSGSWSGHSSGSSGNKYTWSSSGLSGSGSSYPPSNSGLSGSGYKPSYPSSSSGLSGSGSSYLSSSSGLSRSRYKPSYPSSSSGLSGSGSSYPSSNSGLSGSGYKLSYPSSSSGLSGSGSSYPSSNSDLSGSGKNYYPPSTGLSGTGSGKNVYRPSTSGSLFSGTGNSQSHPSSITRSGNQKHTYPNTNGGLWSNNNYRPTNPNPRPSHTHNTNTNYIHSGSQAHGGGPYTLGTYYNPPTYYTAPQNVYVTEYRNSGSRYGDLLTGLALYNLGRTHNNYHDHFYYDDYYNRRYHSSSEGLNSYSKPKEFATCVLKIKDHNNIETLKIPCEIVSTFTADSKKVTAQNTLNTTVCVTQTVEVNNTLSGNTTQTNTKVVKAFNTTSKTNYLDITPILNATDDIVNKTESLNIPLVPMTHVGTNVTVSNNATYSVPIVIFNVVNNTVAANATLRHVSLLSNETNVTPSSLDLLLVQPIQPSNATSSNATQVKTPSGQNSTNTTSNVTKTNVTTCTTTVKTTDPLAVKGPSIDPSGMECTVQILTKDAVLENKVDCQKLIQYARMPKPKKQASSLMPSRSTLKSWLSSPPWWMSIFIAV